MKTQNDVILSSYIKILQIYKWKSKDNTRQTLHANFVSRVKNKRIRGGGGLKYAPSQFVSVFKSPDKIGLSNTLGTFVTISLP